MAVEDVWLGGPHGPQDAVLVFEDRAIGRAELDDLVGERRAALGRQRSLVLLRGGNDLEFVVTYLAARAGGHPLILSEHESAIGLIDRYRPDVVVSTETDGVEFDRRRSSPVHELHP